LSIRSAQEIPVRENRKRTELRANETHWRGRGGRRTLRVVQDLRRIAGYGIATGAVPAMLVSGTQFGRSGGIRRRTATAECTCLAQCSG
jgi:hypothetical protein